MQRNLSLLGLTSRRDLSTRILKPAAEKAQARKQHDQALSLFHIAGDYGLVLTTLNGRLGDLLQRSSSGEAREAFARARAVLVQYGDGVDSADPAFTGPRSTCDLLLTLEEVLRLANDGQAVEAQAVRQIRIACRALS